MEGLHEQVITLCAATHKVMLDVDVDKIKEFQMDMLGWFDVKHPEIGREIEGNKTLTDDLVQRIVDAANQYKTSI